MKITMHTLQQMLNTAAEMGTKQIIDRLGLEKRQISTREAYKIYDRTRVDMWKKEGLVDYVKQGTRRIFFDKSQLEKQASIHRLVERCYGKDKG
ncbi:MAG: hypothetical protein AB2L24_29485 [Mangrovibacterium sp.]